MDMTFFYFFVVVGERQRVKALDSIRYYQGYPFETHNSTTRSWRILPYTISPLTWFQYYRELTSILRNAPANTDIFICGTVFAHFIIFYEEVRWTVYSMFHFNAPYSVLRFWGRVRFRLLFIGSTAIEGRIEFERFSVTTTYSDRIYHDMFAES